MSDDTYFEPPAHAVFGPQGVHVAALIDLAGRLTPDETSALAAALAAARDAAWGAAWDAVWDAAGDAARGAVLDAAWDAAWDAVWDAAGALVVRDLITTDHYDTLTRAWRTVIGPIHPEDPDIRRAAR